MAETAEVVIVGGGVAGCATAYFLAKMGVRATIIERESVGSCASGFAAGLLNPLDSHGLSGPLERLAAESFRMHLRLEKEVQSESGVDPRYQALPGVWVAFDDAQAENFTGILQQAHDLEDFPAHRLDGRELKSLEPRVSADIVSAMYVDGLRQVESYEYNLALATAAEKYGATMRHGEVRGLKRSNGRVSGVVLEKEEVDCESVVLAMGPWTGQVESWLGAPVPVGPLKGQILRLEMGGPKLEQVFYLPGGGYISSKADGLIWLGTTEERVGFDDRPTPEARESIMMGALKTIPPLSEARLTLQTACLRPVSEDGLPMIGEVPGWQGVYLATGAGRSGILLRPAMGQAVADLVTKGRTDLPIDACSPSRFAQDSEVLN